jgi:hypothetical protein
VNRTNKPRQGRFSCQLEKNSDLHSFTDRQTKRCNCRPLRLFRSACSQLNVEKVSRILRSACSALAGHESKAFESRLVMVVISRILFRFQQPLGVAKSLRRSDWPDEFELELTSFRAVVRDATRLTNESTRFPCQHTPTQKLGHRVRMFNHTFAFELYSGSVSTAALADKCHFHLFISHFQPERRKPRRGIRT